MAHLTPRDPRSRSGGRLHDIQQIGISGMCRDIATNIGSGFGQSRYYTSHESRADRRRIFALRIISTTYVS